MSGLAVVIGSSKRRVLESCSFRSDQDQQNAFAMARIRKRPSRAGLSDSTGKEGAEKQRKEAAKQAAAEESAKQGAALEVVKQAAAEDAAKQGAACVAAKQAAAQEAAAEQAVQEAAKAKDDSVDDELETELKQKVFNLTHAVKEIETRSRIEVIELNRLRASLRKLKVDAVDRDSARAKRMEELKLLAQKVLSKIRNHKHAWLFMEPVDADTLGLWDYHEVIEKPMDLGTIQRLMDAKDGTGYTNVKEVRDDVRLVFSNAVTYNPKNSDAHTMATVISRKFEAQWKAVVEPEMQEEESKWTLQLREDNALWVVLKLAERDATEKVECNLDCLFENLDKQLEHMKQKATPPGTTISLVEKAELRGSLSRLSGDNRRRIIQILAQANSGFNANTDEAFLCFNATNDDVEVNIYGLDSAAVRRLHGYVQSVTKGRPTLSIAESSPHDAPMTTLL